MTSKAFDEALAMVKASRTNATTVDDLRREAARANEVMLPILNADLPRVGEFHEAVTVYEPAGTRVTADVIVPEGAGPHPILVYLHGGGFVMGSAEADRVVGFSFAAKGFLVISVDYRLAPEFPFPNGYLDAERAVQWALEVGPDYGGDPSRLAIAGCSAGAALAASVAVNSQSAGHIRASLLLYGGGDSIAPTEPPATAVMFAAMMAAYLQGNDPLIVDADPRLSPLRHPERFPPSYIAVGTADPFFAACTRIDVALTAAHVRHRFDVLEGQGHGFLPYLQFIPVVAALFERMVDFLHEELDAR
jgi:acetyl esterase